MRRRTTTTLSVCSLLLALAAVPASALPRERERWLRLESANFVLFSSAGEAASREIATDLEHLRATLGKLAPGARLNTPLPTAIYVFRNDAAFRPYKLLYEGKPAKVSGYFVAHEHGNYVAIDGNPKSDPQRIVYHEYLHYFLRNNFPTAPLWLNEGMAELYSNFDVVGGRAKIGLPVREHLITLRRYGLLPLAELLAVDRSSPSYNEGTRQGIYYAQTWLLAHYLLIGSEERAGEVRTYLTDLRGGRPPAEAFAGAFGDDLEALGKELAGYLRSYQMGFLSLELEDEVPTAIRVAELERAELLYRLGDLLAHADAAHADAAREHLEAALELDPEHAPSLAVLGFLAAEANDDARALELLGRAASLAPDDHQVQYLHGTSLLRSLPGKLTPQTATAAQRAALERARTAFERSVALRPENAEAWVNLGFTYTLEERPPERALEALEQAHRLLPARVDVAYNLLLVYSRLGHRERAEALHARLPALGADDATLTLAREALLNLDVDRLNELLAAQRLEEAVPLMESILERTGDAGMRRELGAKLVEIRQLLAHNRFVERYNEAARLTNRREYDGALAILEELLESVAGEERDDVLYLLEEVRTLRAARER